MKLGSGSNQILVSSMPDGKCALYALASVAYHEESGPTFSEIEAQFATLSLSSGAIDLETLNSICSYLGILLCPPETWYETF